MVDNVSDCRGDGESYHLWEGGWDRVQWASSQTTFRYLALCEWGKCGEGGGRSLRACGRMAGC